MFVSGFTIVRNAVRLDYPVREAIQSILPVVDEMIVLIGNSDDETYNLISSIESDKIKIHYSTWDEKLRKGGKVLAHETDKAFRLISPEADWAFYIQADEILHEKFYDSVQGAMHQYKNINEADGLLFGYRHFYGSYDFVCSSRDFYRNEIRIIRNNPEIHSYRDAQGFRKGGKKLLVKKVDAEIYHYGWVRHPKVMGIKIREFHQLWHNDEWIAANEKLSSEFDYSKVDALARFEGTHPAVMSNRIASRNWNFNPNLDKIGADRSGVKKMLGWIEKQTGYRAGEYKNYILLR